MCRFQKGFYAHYERLQMVISGKGKMTFLNLFNGIPKCKCCIQEGAWSSIACTVN